MNKTESSLFTEDSVFLNRFYAFTEKVNCSQQFFFFFPTVFDLNFRNLLDFVRLLNKIHSSLRVVGSITETGVPFRSQSFNRYQQKKKFVKSDCIILITESIWRGAWLAVGGVCDS